jgi:hypothetical protein
MPLYLIELPEEILQKLKERAAEGEEAIARYQQELDEVGPREYSRRRLIENGIEDPSQDDIDEMIARLKEYGII